MKVVMVRKLVPPRDRERQRAGGTEGEQRVTRMAGWLATMSMHGLAQ